MREMYATRAKCRRTCAAFIVVRRARARGVPDTRTTEARTGGFLFKISEAVVARESGGDAYVPPTESWRRAATQRAAVGI